METRADLSHQIPMIVQQLKQSRKTQIISNSAVFQHEANSNHKHWTLSVIQQAREPTDLRIREKLAIEQTRPALNSMYTSHN